MSAEAFFPRTLWRVYLRQGFIRTCNPPVSTVSSTSEAGCYVQPSPETKEPPHYVPEESPILRELIGMPGLLEKIKATDPCIFEGKKYWQFTPETYSKGLQLAKGRLARSPEIDAGNFFFNVQAVDTESSIAAANPDMTYNVTIPVVMTYKKTRDVVR